MQLRRLGRISLSPLAFVGPYANASSEKVNSLVQSYQFCEEGGNSVPYEGAMTDQWIVVPRPFVLFAMTNDPANGRAILPTAAVDIYKEIAQDEFAMKSKELEVEKAAKLQESIAGRPNTTTCP